MGARRGVGARKSSRVSAPPDAPIRVLQVIAGLDPAIGGPPVSAIQTSLALREQGLINEFAFVFDAPKPGVLQNVALLREAGIAVYGFPIGRLPGPLGPRWGFSPRLAWWLVRSARRYDVLHMHGAWTFTTFVGLLSARLSRRVAVLSTHESLTDFDRAKSSWLGRLVKRVLRRFYLSTFGVVVVSSALEQRDSGDPGGRRSVVIPHAVPRFAHAARVATHLRGPLAVGFLGRLHPKKNLDVVIESVARQDDNVTLRVAGDGPERDRLLRLARDLRVDERTTWVGFVQADDKAEFLHSIDVLVMPSAYECFGVAAVEALAAGVPVIVSPTVGVANVIRQHACGLVVDPDVESVADALTQLAHDPALLERLRQTATATVDAEFSSERHGQRLHNEYLRLLRRPLAHVTAPAVGEMP